MGIPCETIGEVLMVTPASDYLDASNTADFKRDVIAAIGSHKKVALDLHAVQFIDSSGCGIIISLLRHQKANGGDLKLCALVGPVRSVLELVRIHKIIDILNSREEALRAFEL